MPITEITVSHFVYAIVYCFMKKITHPSPGKYILVLSEHASNFCLIFSQHMGSSFPLAAYE